MPSGPGSGGALRLPELNVFVFAVLLNFPWEFLQTPLFEDMAGAPHWQAIKRCGVATLADGAIMLAAFWIISAVSKRRTWILEPKPRQVLGFAGMGLLITVAIERLATQGLWPETWAYAEAMPVIPIIGAGLSPVLQWVLLPPLTLWFVRRQLT